MNRTSTVIPNLNEDRDSQNSLQNHDRQRAQENFNRQKSNIVISSDINDLFLRAAFDGDISQLQYFHQLMKQQSTEPEEIWNKSLLAFFLAIHNSQAKVSNLLFKKYELLRVLVYRLIRIYDQSVNPKRAAHTNQYSYKIKDHQMTEQKSKADELAEDSQDSQSRAQDQSRSSAANSRSYQANNNSAANQPSDNDSNDHSRNVGERSEDLRRIKEVKAGVNILLQDIQKEDLAELPKSYFKQVILFQQNRTSNEVNKLKTILKSEFAISFNSNLLKIALNANEDRIGALIVARFPVLVDQGIIDYAVQSKSMIFIHNVFYYGKNYLIPETQTNIDDLDEEKVINFSVEHLIQKIHNSFDFIEAEQMLNQIIGWRFETRKNILKTLIDIGHERVATYHMDQYDKFSDWDFFFHCVTTERQFFIKHSLRRQYFDSDYMHREQLTIWLMERLNSGQNILYPLNLLRFADFRKWSFDQLREFIRYAKTIIVPNLETSFMLITYNPIMSLGLTIEYLKKIRAYYNVYDLECNLIIKKLELLGKLIIETIPFEDVEPVFMEQDFTERSTLNVIIDNDIKPYIVINKLNFLLHKIWDGKDASKIDGKTLHFSKTKYLLYHDIKMLKGVKITFGDVVGNSFKPNIEDYNYIFQKKFRMQSIFIILVKDFFCATLLVIIFQYINYLYLNNFTQRRYQDAVTDQEKVDIISAKLSEYKKINFIGTILSTAFFLSLIYRVIYNVFSKRKIKYDIWLLFDILSGVVNIAAFNIIGNATPDKILDANGAKRWYDYYMICVLVISWLRFFSYFLVIKSVSKVTITLFYMIYETVSFMIILISYLILMTTVFATMFRDVSTDDAEPFHNLSTTFRVLTSYFVGNYANLDMANFNTSFSVMYMIHVVISYIFLMQFLVAVLSTVYDAMIRNGDFYAIQYQYIFITKYMRAIQENNGYDKMIVYPPPLNFILTPLLIFAPSKDMTKKVSLFFVNIVFWIENFFLIIFFFLYFLALDPIIMAKMYYQLAKMDGKLYKLFYMVFWTVSGIFFLLYINIVDTCMLVNILCLENSVAYDQNEDEKVKLERHKFYIYRDIYRGLKEIHKLAEGTSIVFNKRKNLQRLYTQRLSLKQKMMKLEQEIKADDLFVVKRDFIMAAYLLISNQNPYIRAYRESNHTNRSRTSTNHLLASIDFSQIEQRNQMQLEPTLPLEFQSLIGRLMISSDRDNIDELYDFMIDEKDKGNYLDITEDENKLVTQFINKFTIPQKDQEVTAINLQLVLKAFPINFTPQHIYKMDLLHLQRRQKVLISFFNDDQDEMFNYYDNRMKRRLQSLKRNGSKNNHLISRIIDLSKYALEYVQWEEAVQKIKKEVLISKKGTDVSSMKNDMSDFMSKGSAKKSSQYNHNLGALETDDQEEEEGIDFLQREQNKNLLQMLQYKEKNKLMKQNEKDKTYQKMDRISTVQFAGDRALLELPTADEILHQIRTKRKEKDEISENSNDDLNDSYSDKSFKEAVTITKKDGMSTLRMMGTRIGNRRSNVTMQQHKLEEIEDSIQTDKSD